MDRCAYGWKSESLYPAMPEAGVTKTGPSCSKLIAILVIHGVILHKNTATFAEI